MVPLLRGGHSVRSSCCCIIPASALCDDPRYTTCCLLYPDTASNFCGMHCPLLTTHCPSPISHRPAVPRSPDYASCALHTQIYPAIHVLADSMNHPPQPRLFGIVSNVLWTVRRQLPSPNGRLLIGRLPVAGSSTNCFLASSHHFYAHHPL